MTADTPTPTADAREALIKSVAQAIATASVLNSDSGVDPKWSDFRDEARAAINTLSAKGWTPPQADRRELEEACRGLIRNWRGLAITWAASAGRAAFDHAASSLEAALTAHQPAPEAEGGGA